MFGNLIDVFVCNDKANIFVIFEVVRVWYFGGLFNSTTLVSMIYSACLREDGVSFHVESGISALFFLGLSNTPKIVFRTCGMTQWNLSSHKLRMPFCHEWFFFYIIYDTFTRLFVVLEVQRIMYHFNIECNSDSEIIIT